jgi:hypothetical protein
VFDVIGDIKAKVDATLRAALWGIMAAVCGMVGTLFLLIALFIWLAAQYDVLTACVILGLVFVVLALVAALVFTLSRRQSELRSRQRRARTAAQGWLDPRMLASALEIVRLLGSRRTTILFVAAMASGFLLSAVQSSGKADPPDP